MPRSGIESARDLMTEYCYGDNDLVDGGLAD
jgi:hypothetical protein